MVAGQVVGMESFFEGKRGGLEEREARSLHEVQPEARWRRRAETRQGASLHRGRIPIDGGYVQGQEGHTYKSVHASSGHNLYE